MPLFWNGTTYSLDGDGEMAFADDGGFAAMPSKCVVQLAPIPVPSSIQFRLMSNPLADSLDSETVGRTGSFNVGFN